MKLGKIYAHGKHAIAQATKYAPHAILKVFKDAKDADIAQISLFKLLHQYEDFVSTLEITPKTALVLLAGIEDPHNIGAIIRTAAAFGVAGVLMPEVGQAPVSDAVLKVSAGMAFRVPLVLIGGYQQILSDLKKRGFTIAALDQKGKTNLADASFDTPHVFVFGNEGEGIPNAIKPLLDTSLAIPMDARAESLNVAAAAAVTLFAWSTSK
ncbi:RNA methyltransferase [Candidatus Parcubacteria bacterium]|nr:RNA methyltransferase [Candidatus Parcubacteria bacterium]